MPRSAPAAIFAVEIAAVAVEAKDTTLKATEAARKALEPTGDQVNARLAANRAIRPKTAEPILM